MPFPYTDEEFQADRTAVLLAVAEKTGKAYATAQDALPDLLQLFGIAGHPDNLWKQAIQLGNERTQGLRGLTGPRCSCHWVTTLECSQWPGRRYHWPRAGFPAPVACAHRPPRFYCASCSRAGSGRVSAAPLREAAVAERRPARKQL